MVFITVSAVLALAASATSVLGSPWPSPFKHTTHRVRDLDHGVQVRSFQPESTYEVSTIYYPIKLMFANICLMCVCDVFFIFRPLGMVLMDPIHAVMPRLQGKRSLWISSLHAPASTLVVLYTRAVLSVKLQNMSTSVKPS